MTSSVPGVITSPGQLGTGVAQFTVDPTSVPVTTTVTLRVSDSVGGFVNVPVTVNPVVLAITLDKTNVIGFANPDVTTADDVTATVTGGTGPYIVTSSNPALTPVGIWSSSSAPFSFVTDVNNVGVITTVTLTVVDNVGASATRTLTIFPQAATAGIVISVNKPDVIGLANPDGNTTDDVTFTVTGGVPPYIISAGNAALPACGNAFVTPIGPWTIAASGGMVIIDPGAAATTTPTCTLTVTDNIGAIATTTFNVHP